MGCVIKIKLLIASQPHIKNLQSDAYSKNIGGPLNGIIIMYQPTVNAIYTKHAAISADTICPIGNKVTKSNKQRKLTVLIEHSLTPNDVSQSTTFCCSADAAEIQ